MVGVTLLISVLVAGSLIQKQIIEQQNTRLKRAVSSLQIQILEDIPYLDREASLFLNNAHLYILLEEEIKLSGEGKTIDLFLKENPLSKKFLFKYEFKSDFDSYSIYYGQRDNSKNEEQMFLWVEYLSDLKGLLFKGRQLITKSKEGKIKTRFIEKTDQALKKLSDKGGYKITKVGNTAGVTATYPFYYYPKKVVGYLTFKKMLNFKIDIEKIDLGVEITLFDKDGQQVEGTINFDSLSSKSCFKDKLGEYTSLCDSKNERFSSIIEPLRVDKDTVGYIAVSIPDKIVKESVKEAITLLVLGGIMALILAVLIALFIAKRYSIAIQRLVKDSQAMAEGDLEHYIDVPNDKELGELALSFVKMRDSIKDKIEALNIEICDHKMTEEELQNYKSDLEKIVKIRTEDLAIEKNKAELANRSKSEFIANMSHEIRTPMNAILGFSEILSNEISDKKHQSYLKTILSSGRSLLSIINDILDLSKIEAGQLVIKTNSFDLIELINDVKDIFSVEISKKNLLFSVDIEDNTPTCIALDQTRLRQVLINLIGNAVKFTSEGMVRVSIRGENIQYSTHRADLIIEIEDTGIGISRKNFKAIFSAFEQRHEDQGAIFGGTGLGLTISQQMVELMKGSISVESQAGVGSIFTVRFNNIETTLNASATKFTEVPKLPLDIPDTTILVVDDILANRAIVKGFLKPYKIKVIEAEDGEDGIRKMEKYNPSLVFMDIKMPKMDGFKAISEIRKNKRYDEIPVIALTAAILTHEEEKIESVFDGMLSKPLSLKNLIQTLSKHLAHLDLTEKAKNKKVELAMHLPEMRLAQAPLNLEELLGAVEEKIIPLWRERSTLSINQIKKICRESEKIAKEFQYVPILDWTKNVQEHLNLFAIEKVKVELNLFEEIYQRLTEGRKKKENKDIG